MKTKEPPSVGAVEYVDCISAEVGALPHLLKYLKCDTKLSNGMALLVDLWWSTPSLLLLLYLL